jgi:hypothetical protein
MGRPSGAREITADAVKARMSARIMETAGLRERCMAALLWVKYGLLARKA